MAAALISLEPNACACGRRQKPVFPAGGFRQWRRDIKTRCEGGELRMESVLKSRLGMFCAALALVAVSGAAVADEVADRTKDPNLWAAPGGDTELTRHSRLKDINATNVHKLQMIWSQSSGTLRGHEGQPLVVTVDGTPMMYMESGWPNIVQALDLSDPDHPKAIWNYKKTTDRDESAVPRACCDTVNRGMS